MRARRRYHQRLAHGTGTFDGTTGILYVDGVKVAGDTFTPVNSNTGVWFGVNWGGAMQSARLYNRALTASEVSSLYALAPNLALTKTADAASVAAGSSIGYTLTATNGGVGAATSVTVTDLLPSGTGVNWNINPAYSGQGTCAISSGTLTCNLGTLASADPPPCTSPVPPPVRVVGLTPTPPP